jgi:hypothetical protein
MCIFLLTAGAVFWLALPAGSHWGINLNVVGILVLCAGLLGLVLPRLSGMPAQTDRLRRWVIPSGTTDLGQGPAGGYRNGYNDEQATAGDGRQPMVGNLSAEPGRPTLADYLVNAEQDPPL